MILRETWTCCLLIAADRGELWNGAEYCSEVMHHVWATGDTCRQPGTGLMCSRNTSVCTVSSSGPIRIQRKFRLESHDLGLEFGHKSQIRRFQTHKETTKKKLQIRWHPCRWLSKWGHGDSWLHLDLTLGTWKTLGLCQIPNTETEPTFRSVHRLSAFCEGQQHLFWCVSQCMIVSEAQDFFLSAQRTETSQREKEMRVELKLIPFTQRDVLFYGKQIKFCMRAQCDMLWLNSAELAEFIY